MALAFNTGLTLISAADATTGWAGFRHNGGGSPSPAVDTDVKIQNTGCLALKVSGTNRDEGMWFDFGAGNEVDFTTTANKHFWAWVLMTTLGLVKTRALGGIYIIAASDAAGNNWSKWFVEGSDTLEGKWERIVMDMTKTSSEDATTAATMTSVRFIGVGTKTNGTSRLDNFFVDRCDYGQAALQAYADAVGNVNIAWQDYFDEDTLSANKYGVIDKRGTVFYLRGGLTIGLSTQSGTVTFSDATGAVLEFEDPQYDAGSGNVTRIDSANLYTISAEAAATQATTITLGNVVGSGDDRQGVQGGLLQSAAPSWDLDFATDIADFVTVNIYGVTFSGAGGGIAFDDGNKTTVISCTFLNCGEVTPGSVNNGAEILSCAFIDPDDFALQFPNTTHNVKKISFITSGTPTTQHMAHLSQAADYTIIFDAVKYFGSFASSTLWHGENSGNLADVTISALNEANPVASEFENTGSPTPGTVTVSNDVTLKVTVKDKDGVAIATAQTAIYRDSDDVELMNKDTDAGGIASTTFNYSVDTNVTVRVRKGSTAATKYIPVSSPQIIKSSGLDIVVTLFEDTDNSS